MDQPGKKANPKKKLSLYLKVILTKRVSLPFNQIGQNIEDILLVKISQQIEGRCIAEGFIKPKSLNLIRYSTGSIKGANVHFEVVLEGLVCRPVEGMRFPCFAKNITKAGIRAETKERVSPVVVFIARDHYYQNTYFSSIKEDQQITIKVIGTRFELNDKYISVIADLVPPKKSKRKKVLIEK